MSSLFLGYSPAHKVYKCLDLQSKRLYISRDVLFNEATFPYSKFQSTHIPTAHISHTSTVQLPLLSSSILGPTQAHLIRLNYPQFLLTLILISFLLTLFQKRLTLIFLLLSTLHLNLVLHRRHPTSHHLFFSLPVPLLSLVALLAPLDPVFLPMALYHTHGDTVFSPCIRF